MESQNQAVLYTALGPDMTRFAVDVETGELRQQGSIRAPENVQFAWVGGPRRLLYVVSTNGNHADPGTSNWLNCYSIDGVGNMVPYAEPCPLPARSIHMCLDRTGRHILTAYNAPPRLTVHRINDDGSISGQVQFLDASNGLGVYPHHIRVSPSNRTALLLCRGNRRTAAKGSGDPGCILTFSYADGTLSNPVRTAPDGGREFGTRDLDFHPSGKWLFVSLEIQNKLQVFRFEGERLSERPLHSVDTVRDMSQVASNQATGTLHMHPNGKFLYVANRASGTVEFEGLPTFAGGENSIAVFSIDQHTGKPTLIQSEGTRGIHPRTFSIDRSGRLLIAANVMAMRVRGEGTSVTTVPTSLSMYRIAADGTLTFLHRHDLPAPAGVQLWWTGMFAADPRSS